MLVPLAWLKDYVDLPTNPAELVERLTLAGLESAGVFVYGLPVPDGLRVKPENAGLPWDRDKVIVAQVQKIEKHPDADKLKLVTVGYGAAAPKTVVTGAPNIAPGESGMKVVLGLKGSRYFYTDKDGKKTVFTLEPKKLRGIDNDAMCMSNFELGIAEDHDGIIILDDADPAPGTPLQDLLGDIVVELDVLPNMARCLSLLGVAREVAALTGATVREPDLSVPTVDGPAAVKVEIENPTLCARYSATIIRDVTIGPAPRWLGSRLRYAGMRPISNAVDITNYVMLEYGQPLHAFDYDALVKRAGGKTPTIIVRSAKPGETLKTLDGQDRELSPDDLVIADTVGAIALAGVMGGLETEVTAATKNILLESASFDFVSVRKTARKFNLFSEASTRFSKGVHPEVVGPAARRAAQLFQRHAGGQVLADVVDNYPAPIPPRVIELNKTEIHRVLGFELPGEEIERVLTALQFRVEPTLWGWTVTVPPTRLDIQAGAADLIEELARVSGYDKLPESRLAQEMPAPIGNRTLELEDRVRDVLVELGLFEAITYSLSSPEPEAKLGIDGESVVLKNPISPERSTMRRTLLPGLLAVARQNLESTDRVAFFELGPVFLPKANALPDEPTRLAIVMTGPLAGSAWDRPSEGVPRADFFDLKGVVEQLVADLHLSKPSYRNIATVPYLHPGRAAELLIAGEVVGRFGELHPKAAKAFDFKDRAVLVAELHMDAMLARVPERYAYRPFSTFPPAKRDLAVVVETDVSAETVASELRAAGGELLAGVKLFDVYTGPNIPAGTKSLAFALAYQAPDRTLGEKEIQKAHEKVENRLKHVLKARIRGKDLA
ncbi:MAG: phenylalanine--tRNA ligase subunit beta [Gemmataceae bacterium]|nr:phenylalanine--tRNA ligase subunit beta [Gemmataceae bacterium]